MLIAVDRLLDDLFLGVPRSVAHELRLHVESRELRAGDVKAGVTARVVTLYARTDTAQLANVARHFPA